MFRLCYMISYEGFLVSGSIFISPSFKIKHQNLFHVFRLSKVSLLYKML